MPRLDSSLVSTHAMSGIAGMTALGEAEEEAEEDLRQAEADAEEDQHQEVEAEAEAEEDQHQEEEEGMAVEEIEYNGTRYYKDTENFIYSVNKDDEPSENPVGYWKVKTQTIAFYKPK